MSNPLLPKGDEERPGKEPQGDARGGTRPESSIDFTDLARPQAARKQDPESVRQAEQDFFGGKSPEDQISITKSAFTFVGGRLAQFQFRKADLTEEKGDLLSTNVKQAVDSLITRSTRDEEEKLPANLKDELESSRKALSKSETASDIVLHALHLARLYQYLRYIEEAKAATMLALGINPDEVLAKELFKELERMHPQDIAVYTPTSCEQPLSKSNLRRLINNLAGGRMMVVGDLLIDEHLEGKPERISREAPVLILEHTDTRLILGGAANTANNAAALGGVCHVVGVVGEDDYAGKLAPLLDCSGITHNLVADAGRPTTVKTRILSGAHARKQQVLRLDRICHQAVSGSVESRLELKIREKASQYSAIVLSDYRCGTVCDGVIKACRQIAQENNIMLVVDAQDHFERFQNVTLITPNQPDIERAVGFSINSKETLLEAGEELMLLTGARALLVTRGAEGMALFQQGQELFELSAFSRSDVFDVTGAGDTVVAVMTLGLVTGASFVEAMALGNLAAAIVVTKPGTAVTSAREMLEHLEQLDLPE